MGNEKLLERVEKALDEIRPHLEVDGGNIEVVEITEDMNLMVKWIGNCEFCNMSAMTMKAGVQEKVREMVPEIKEVIAINGVQV